MVKSNFIGYRQGTYTISSRSISVRHEPMLSIDGLTKGFGSGSDRLEVLNGIDMEIVQGELVALMGPSGCGKSTLLNIIGGLLEGDSGKIKLNDLEFGTDLPSKLVELRRKGVGWIFQDFHLLPNFLLKFI